EDVQAKIFDPFFTTKAVGKGTGLGLTVAFAIMQDHGGRIRVHSDAGEGASFFVELPAGGNLTPHVTPQVSAEPEPTAADAAVLVVEDEPALAAAVSEALSDAGFRVDRAGDGKEALTRIRA
ncbi:MAG: hybrid sensor histidine kinase/response regulator, partial [Gammaproteobacteria bacterium]|nr:hybrid sensor histidine kinase/response regulator [Gammaproteobacteria bacterium]